MSPCPFCDLIGGDRDRTIVYEDGTVIAFMPLRPLHEGHVLVMPKTHYLDVFRIPAPELVQLFRAAGRISRSLDGLFRPPKVATLSAGLLVEHAHLHLIPVFGEGDLTTRSEFEGTTLERTRLELDRLSAAIRDGLGPA
ncbi:MAG TPA: HIT domain-containing protein [Holophaga sp.]|nr:HIT domain-containing protein [Holophaga sp.]HPS67041.1 HIT domain-containing protein [Holophaga sp.]